MVTAYANKDQFRKFQKLVTRLKLLPPPGIPVEMGNQGHLGFGMFTNYETYVQMLNDLATDYPKSLPGCR
ncbi:MAG: hypothetical protein IPN18_06895 [Ignavibacteriales bacterium]|nr:hypothetical protein [Ignavibacteriales bacterium]